MRRQKLIEAVVVAGFAALWGGVALADGGGANTEEYSARLNGFNVTGALPSVANPAAETGAILTDGTGTLQLDVDKKSQMATYTLTFSNLSSDVTQAHIHFGKVHTPGGIMVYFCTNLGNGPAGTPMCPASGGTVTGTWTAASVVAIPGQNVTAGKFDALTDALTSNTAYANVHTTNFKAGEIRGQVRKSEKDHN
jgi:CHRD domain